MGVWCSINTILNFDHNTNNIKIVLNRGQQIGTKYYMGLSEQEINVDEAVYTVMHNDPDAEEMIFLKAFIKEAEINIYCYSNSKDNKLSVDFSIVSNIWEKKYGNMEYYEFDIKRYLDIILEFLTPFKILKLSYEIL